MNHSTLDPTIILGGGFTGLFTALHLSHNRYEKPVILIDQHERFTFSPLLYEFLGGEMTDNQVWPRYEELLDGSSVRFVQDTVKAINLEQRQVEIASGSSYSYNYLVLALGTTTGYFGVEGAREHSLPFRNGEQAVALAKHLRDCLQRATQTASEQRRTLTAVAIVGAGPSGIELAATLADLLPNWYSELGGNPQEIRIVVVDQKHEILDCQGNDKSSVKDTAQKALQERNVPVELLLGAKVCSVGADRLEFQRGEQTESIPTATVIWTAGTTALPVIKELPIAQDKRDRSCRLHVTPTLQLLDFPEVFAGGDCAADAKDPLPPTAQVAYQQGSAIAHNLKALQEGKSLSPAKVSFRGTLLKLGLGESSANIFDRFEIKGKLGHLIRQATYLELLPTPVRNFKVTAGWLADEIFQHYSNPASLASLTASSKD